MADTGDSARQAVDLKNLIQEYMHFEKVSLNLQKRIERQYPLFFNYGCDKNSVFLMMALLRLAILLSYFKEVISLQ